MIAAVDERAFQFPFSAVVLCTLLFWSTSWPVLHLLSHIFCNLSALVSPKSRKSSTLLEPSQICRSAMMPYAIMYLYSTVTGAELFSTCHILLSYIPVVYLSGCQVTSLPVRRCTNCYSLSLLLLRPLKTHFWHQIQNVAFSFTLLNCSIVNKCCILLIDKPSDCVYIGCKTSVGLISHSLITVFSIYNNKGQRGG